MSGKKQRSLAAKTARSTILSCVLFVPLYMTYSMRDITLRPLVWAIALCAMSMNVIVQLRMALHARKTAVLLAALSE